MNNCPLLKSGGEKKMEDDINSINIDIQLTTTTTVFVKLSIEMK